MKKIYVIPIKKIGEGRGERWDIVKVSRKRFIEFLTIPEDDIGVILKKSSKKAIIYELKRVRIG